ncbi:MAG: tail fiber protein [Bryobacteraceae bacterium]|nr:tail fiber protein [Bryobacteraceae bacterium]
MSDPFVAEVRILPYTFAPYGWALCQGQILPISQYTAVFSLLGTNYGGNGTSNFALPNLQGRLAIGAGQGPGLSPYSVGETGGVENVTLTPQQLAAHNHGAVAVHDAGNTYSPAGDEWSADGANRAKIYGAAAPTVAMGANALSPAGGGQPHNNLQPYIAINYCIALQGVFPARS